MNGTNSGMVYTYFFQFTQGSGLPLTKPLVNSFLKLKNRFNPKLKKNHPKTKKSCSGALVPKLK